MKLREKDLRCVWEKTNKKTNIIVVINYKKFPIWGYISKYIYTRCLKKLPLDRLGYSLEMTPMLRDRNQSRPSTRNIF